MFNIDFGSSNSAQIPVGKFDIKEYKDGNLSTLYISSEQLPKLYHFLKDIREMKTEDFEMIMNDIVDMNKEHNQE